MLKNKKLLYILPEMAFTASVGETPKEDYFFVETFHQINGDFMRDENFIHESLKKLFERVEEDHYTLVLPDFLFTDTIVNVPEIEDVKIAEYLRDQLLPRIEVSTFSHETRTSVLLQRKTTSKVQLSAFEKELAASLKLAIGGKAIYLDEIVPMSWALKAAVSLEPSLTIAQLGERLYLAEHYIGINQTVNAPLTDLDIIAETVKTLKGSDPNLQTTYLFTSVLVEEKLKKFLLKTLPVQQLTENSEGESKIPSYVKQIIEVTARTLSLPDFAVPRFTVSVDDLSAPVPAATTIDDKKEVSAPEDTDDGSSVTDASDTNEPVAAVTATETINEPKAVESPLPENSDKANPAMPEETATATTDTVITDNDHQTSTAEDDRDGTATSESVVPETSTQTQPETESATPEAANIVKTGQEPAAQAPVAEPEATVSDIDQTVAEPAPTASAVPTITPKTGETQPHQPDTLTAATATAVTTTNLAQNATTAASAAPLSTTRLSFMDHAGKSPITNTQPKSEISAENSENHGTINQAAKRADDKPKKKGNMASFIKKLLLFLLIFVVVIALGIGVGWGILALTGKDVFKSKSSPTPPPETLTTPEPVAVEPSPVPESSPAAEPEPEPTEELDPAEYKVLVVNATGVAGLAGKVKTALEKEGFSGVQTGNASGEYEDKGTFVLMKEKSTALIKLLEKATDRQMTYDEDYKVEDANGKYDAVIVINEE